MDHSANDLHMVQLTPLPPRHLYFSKIQNGLPFWYWLEKVKRLLLSLLHVTEAWLM